MSKIRRYLNLANVYYFGRKNFQSNSVLLRHYEIMCPQRKPTLFGCNMGVIDWKHITPPSTELFQSHYTLLILRTSINWDKIYWRSNSVNYHEAIQRWSKTIFTIITIDVAVCTKKTLCTNLAPWTVMWTLDVGPLDNHVDPWPDIRAPIVIYGQSLYCAGIDCSLSKLMHQS